MVPAPRWRLAGGIAPPSRGITTAVRTKRAMEAGAAAKRPVREPVSVDAPPLSSSDEEGDDKVPSDDISDSSSPENDRSRGSIQSTAFKQPGAAATVNRAKSARQRRRGQLLVADEMRKSSVGSSGGSGSEGGLRGTKRPRPAEDSAPSTTNSISNSNGIAFGRSRPMPKTTYGGRQRPGLPTAHSASTASTKSKAAFKRFEDSASDLSEPEEATTKRTPPRRPSPPASKARFIKPPELSPEKAKTPPKFKHNKWAQSDDEDEDKDEVEDEDEERQRGTGKGKETKKYKPPRDAPKPTFKPPKGLKDDSDDGEEKDNDKRRQSSSVGTEKSETSTATATKTKTTNPDEPVSKKNLFQSRQTWRKNLEKNKLTKKDKSSQIFGQLDVEGTWSDKEALASSPSSPPPPPQRAVFKMPEFNESFPAGGDEQNDSDDLLPDLLDNDDKDNNNDDDAISVADSDDTMAYKGPAVCPLCKVPLDEAMLRNLLPNHYLLAGVSFARIAKTRSVIPLNLLKFDEKVRFCTGHKQRASRLAWTARGYPAIDWDGLPARLVRYEKHIHRVLLGKTASPYRTSWEDSPNTSLVTTIPGYYGRRGLRVLSDTIVQRHAQALRKRVVEDPLVAARGMAQYVQAVLVPELAVQLIREDMQAGGAGASSADEARRVLAESAAIGEDVMDEERDVIDDDEDEEDEEGVDREEDDDGYDYMST